MPHAKNGPISNTQPICSVTTRQRPAGGQIALTGDPQRYQKERILGRHGADQGQHDQDGALGRTTLAAARVPMNTHT